MCQNPVTPNVHFLFRLVLVLLLLAPTLTAPARASDLDDFHEAVEAVNRPYTSALFYLRTGNTGLASLDLGAAASRWEKFAERYKSHPPVAMTGDDDWDGALGTISSAFEKGTELTKVGDGKGAHEALLAVRNTLYDLRRRNRIRILPDCIFELNKQMDLLFEYRHNPTDLEKVDQRNRVTEMGEKYEKLVDECRQLAPKILQQDVDFKSLFDGASKSIKSIVRPIEARNQRGVINVLRELHSFDRLIWLRWG